MQEDPEKVAEQISRDVSQLCSQLAALWSRFLDAALLNPHILSYLAQEHHTLRVRGKSFSNSWIAFVTSILRTEHFCLTK